MLSATVMDIADELHQIAVGIDQDYFTAALEKVIGLLSVTIYLTGISERKTLNDSGQGLLKKLLKKKSTFTGPPHNIYKPATKDESSWVKAGHRSCITASEANMR